MSEDTVSLSRASYDVPWGFRLVGGADNNQPITVQRVMPGSVAATGLTVGDVITGIGDVSVQSLPSSAVMELIRDAGNLLQFRVVRSSAAIPEPSSTIPTAQTNPISNGPLGGHQVKPAVMISTGARSRAVTAPGLNTSPAPSQRSDAPSSASPTTSASGASRYRPSPNRSGPVYDRSGRKINQSVTPTMSLMSMGTDYSKRNRSAPATPPTHQQQHSPPSLQESKQTLQSPATTELNQSSEQQYHEPQQQPISPIQHIQVNETSTQQHLPLQHPTPPKVSPQAQSLQKLSPRHQSPHYQSPPQHQSPQHQSPQHQSPQHQSPQHQSPQHQSLQHQSPQHQYPQHQSPHYQSPPQHQSPQHQSPQHQSPQHQSPRHQSPQHPSPRHQSPQYQSPRQLSPQQHKQQHLQPQKQQHMLHQQQLSPKQEQEQEQLQLQQSMQNPSTSIETPNQHQYSKESPDDLPNPFVKKPQQFSYRQRQQQPNIASSQQPLQPQQQQLQPEQLQGFTQPAHHPPDVVKQQLPYSQHQPREGHVSNQPVQSQFTKHPVQSPLQNPQHQMPPAVQNMAARTAATNKVPFSYTPDINSLKQQAHRVRQKGRKDFVQTQTNQGQTRNISLDRGNLTVAAELRRQRRRELGLDVPEDHCKSFNGNVPSEVATSQPSTQPEFDEQAYLAGHISIMGGQPSRPVVSHVSENTRPVVEDVEEEKPFDEEAYLAGRIPLVQGGPIDPSTFNIPVKKRPVKKYREENKPKLAIPFDEQAYLSGKINILGNPIQKAPLPPRVKPTSTRACWQKDDAQTLSEDEYNEESFLKGRLSLVRTSVDRKISQRVRDTARPRQRERAVWERDTNNDDIVTSSDAEFDETAFLGGKTLKQDSREQSVDSDREGPTRTLRVLRRSASNDRRLDTEDVSVGFSCFSEDDAAGSDYDKTFSDFVYVGKSFPSKTFSKLKKTIARKTLAERNQPIDSIERLKNKSVQAQHELDVDKAVETLTVENNDPQAYMELLKTTSVQQTQAKEEAEVEAESTEF